MRITYFNNPVEFQEVVSSFLRRREAENNIPLGILGRLVARHGNTLPEHDTPLLCTIEEDEEIVGVAVQTPPYALNLSRMPEAALHALVKSLTTSRRNLFGAVGPRDIVAAFCALWTRSTGASVSREKDLLLYELGTLRDAHVRDGVAAFATEKDFDVAVGWTRDFAAELGLPVGDPERDSRERIEQKTLMFWKTERPVAMASYRAVTPTAARVGLVYTPPDARRNGYASGVVHALSKHLLDTGRTSCFLFTDADNPGPNAIYQKLGYRKIGAFAEYWFV